MLGDDAGGELLGGHFQGKEPDYPAIDRGHMAIGPNLAAPGLGNIVGNVGGERGFAHAGPTGEDDQVGGLQTAHLIIEIGQACCQTGKAAVALIGARRHVDRCRERLGEALETRIVTAGLGNFVKLSLGLLDVLQRGRIDRRIIGEVHHVLADRDQVAADREIVDRAAVILGVDDRGRLGGKARQILIEREAGNIGVARQKRLKRDRRGDLAGANKTARQLENALVDRLEEVLGFQEIGNAIERLVIDEDGTEQSLLGLDIVRCRAERRLRGHLLASGRIENWHDPGQSNRALWPICGTRPTFGESSLEKGYSTSRFTQRQQRLCA